jgi:hypothetical protein
MNFTLLLTEVDGVGNTRGAQTLPHHTFAKLHYLSYQAIYQKQLGERKESNHCELPNQGG